MFLFLINIANASHYKHFAIWEATPNIVVCGKNTQTIEEVKESLLYWEKLGYNFGSIKKQEVCPTNKKGLIVIKSKYFENKQGNTYVEKYYYKSNPNKEFLESAVIDLNNHISLYNQENKDSLVHELGHALGIDHVHDKKDIMFPYAN